jgi:hypothetical protein
MLTEEQKKKLRNAGYNESKISAYEKLKSGTADSSIISRVGDSLKTSMQTAKEQTLGTGASAQTSAPTRGFQLASTVTSLPVKAALSVLPESAQGALSKVGSVVTAPIRWLGDKIGNIEALQKFTQNNPQATKVIDELAQIAQSTTETAGNVAIAQGAISGVKDVVGATKKVAGTIADTTDDVISKTKQIFTGSKAKIGDEILPIPETVKTTLKRTTDSQFKSYVNQAKQAVTDQSSITPLELAGEKGVEALNKIQSKVAQYGKLKNSSIGTFGDKNVGTIATKFRQSLESNIKGKNIIGEGDTSLVKSIIDGSKKLGNNPTAKQVDTFIDEAQDLLYTSGKNLTVPVSDATTATIKKYLGELNNSLKAQLPKSYSVYNDKFSNIIGIRDELNKALGYDASKGGSLLKRVFSPTDSGTKKLFETVLKETGINLTDEAVLAKFAMELFGDSRQTSILQQLSIPTQRGLIEKIITSGGRVAGFEDWVRNLKISKASALTK